MTIRILCPVLLALAGLSGCDDPVPPTPQGAASFKLASQPNTSAGCPEGSSPPRVSVGSVTATSAVPLVNEENGATVQCTVREEGGLYTILAQVRDAEGNSFTIQSTEASAGPQLPVGATMSTPGKINTLGTTPGESCTLDVQTATDGSNSFGIAPGRVWGTISCPSLFVFGAPENGPKCALGVPNGEKSYVLFENCDS